MKGLHELDEDTALAISSIEVNGVKIRVERATAREQLMKHLGLYREDNSQKPAPGTVHVEGVRKVVFEKLPPTRKG